VITTTQFAAAAASSPGGSGAGAGPTLAITGANAGPLGATGLGLVVIGLVFAFVRRRRTPRHR
jgi:hypothetical protein